MQTQHALLAVVDVELAVLSVEAVGALAEVAELVVRLAVAASSVAGLVAGRHQLLIQPGNARAAFLNADAVVATGLCLALVDLELASLALEAARCGGDEVDSGRIWVWVVGGSEGESVISSLIISQKKVTRKKVSQSF